MEDGWESGSTFLGFEQGSKTVSFVFLKDHSPRGLCLQPASCVLVQEKGGRGLDLGGLRNEKRQKN